MHTGNRNAGQISTHRFLLFHLFSNLRPPLANHEFLIVNIVNRKCLQGFYFGTSCCGTTQVGVCGGGKLWTPPPTPHQHRQGGGGRGLVWMLISCSTSNSHLTSKMSHIVELLVFPSGGWGGGNDTPPPSSTVDNGRILVLMGGSWVGSIPA